VDIQRRAVALIVAGAMLAGVALAVPASAPAAAPPPGYNLDSRQAIRIARTDPKLVAEESKYGRLVPSAQAKNATWEVGFYKRDRELVLVIVDDATGTVKESWTGYQVAWQMARGYPGAFGRKINAPYVWLPLCGFFLLGLLDWRRWRRIVHLDLAVLLAFGVSHIFFNDADIGVSVPLVYPVLAYLLARMLWVGFRGRGEGLRPSLRTGWLALGVVFLLAFRVALNLADSNVIDVGYAGVIGADRTTHGQPIYGADTFPSDNATGDTYGPANYYAYVPFELAFPWSGSWDDLPAAHGAAIAFDLITVAGLFWLGRRIRPGPRGTRLGVILAYAWAAYPYTAFALESNSNDTLVAALVVGVLLLISSPVGRGAMLGIAGMTKFAPLALAPLFAVGVREGPVDDRPRRLRRLDLPLRQVVPFTIALVVVTAILLAWPAIDPGLSTFWHRTVASQAGRDSPFSIWGQTSLGGLHVAVEVLAAMFAIAIAFVPRRRDLRQVAALGAAAMIAVEVCLDHWFYLYIPWFFPLLIVALALGPELRARRQEETDEQVEVSEEAGIPVTTPA
jgi:Glycosyltransferase family 87